MILEIEPESPLSKFVTEQFIYKHRTVVSELSVGPDGEAVVLAEEHVGE